MGGGRGGVFVRAEAGRRVKVEELKFVRDSVMREPLAFASVHVVFQIEWVKE